jgi:3-oxoacyl-[acyl-carrier-protein] synthase-1
MKTAVGNHAAQTCASVRAGVSRFSEWPHFGGSLDEDGTALVASATRPDSGSAPWYAKAVELGLQPLYEAVWGARLYDFDDPQPAYRVALYLAVPSAERAGTASHTDVESALAQWRHSAPGLRDARVHTVPADHAAGLLAVAAAVQALHSGAVDVVIVGGIDSFLDNMFLGWLHDERRLKTPTTPIGIIPGEAAGFIVLEREADARQRGAALLGRIASIAVDRETPAPGPRDSTRPDAFGRAVRAALDPVGGAGNIGRIVVDLNGERWRFLEWAVVEARCLGQLPARWELWHPADCVGDVGAAFAPLALGMAAHAYERGYPAPGGGTLVCAASDRGERAAACLWPITQQGG